eukprot:1194520-Prorocentrum_minimum.AAC.6
MSTLTGELEGTAGPRDKGWLLMSTRSLTKAIPLARALVEWEFWSDSNNGCGDKCNAIMSFLKHLHSHTQNLDVASPNQSRPTSPSPRINSPCTRGTATVVQIGGSKPGEHHQVRAALPHIPLPGRHAHKPFSRSSVVAVLRYAVLMLDVPNNLNQFTESALSLMDLSALNSRSLAKWLLSQPSDTC